MNAVDKPELPSIPCGSVVAIVGLGLMGGSLAAAIKASRPDIKVIGVARRPETLAQATERGFIDEGFLEPEPAAQAADILVLAVPVLSIVNLVGRLAPLLREGAVLTDLGSTKVAVIQAMEKVRRGAQCVGSHPICGKEVSGLDASDPQLYRGATWVLCPTDFTATWAMELVASLAKEVGAEPVVYGAAEHDAILARTSHLPFAVAACLTRTIAKKTAPHDLRLLSAGGYRDTTRLAGSDPQMMQDILVSNRANILEAIEQMQAELEVFKQLLANEAESGAAGLLRGYLEETRSLRRQP